MFMIFLSTLSFLRWIIEIGQHIHEIEKSEKIIRNIHVLKIAYSTKCSHSYYLHYNPEKLWETDMRYLPHCTGFVGLRNSIPWKRIPSLMQILVVEHIIHGNAPKNVCIIIIHVQTLVLKISLLINALHTHLSMSLVRSGNIQSKLISQWFAQVRINLEPSDQCFGHI